MIASRNDGAVLLTERLILRHWHPCDREPFARLNADPQVMQFLPRLLSPEESDAAARRIEDHFRRHGFGLYAAELRERGEFIGFIGLSIPAFKARFSPCIEIGWRLAAAHWGKGLATEGAHAVAGHAFGELSLAEIVSFTVPANTRSRRVMEKLGMDRSPQEDFNHPQLPPGHPLRRHVLYRLSRSRWNHGPTPHVPER